MKKLSTTHWGIYNAIKEGGTLSQKELCSLVPGLTYVEKATNCKNDEKGDHCKPLLNYVREINASPEVEKIIIIKDYTYKLGTEEECQAYCLKLMQRAIKMMEKANAVRRKMKADGQGKIVSCQGNEINEASTARRFTEAYPNG